MHHDWKTELVSVWIGCFFTSVALSQVVPFLPLYIEQLGVHGHEALNLWSGLVFSATFVVSAIVAPLWGILADKVGRKPMLLRAALGMSITVGLQGLVDNVYQLLVLRAIMGLTSGYIPNATALMAAQVPKQNSGWALATLSTASICGMIIGPLLGGVLADFIGLRAVFFITAVLLFICFMITQLKIHEPDKPPEIKSEIKQTMPKQKHGLTLLSSLLFLLVTTMVVQIMTSSVNPILSLFVKTLLKDSDKVALISGIIAAIPGLSALLCASKFGRLADKVGHLNILCISLCCSAVLFILMANTNTVWGLGILRFLLGFSMAALMPTIQALLLSAAPTQEIGRVFGYNQSFLYIGNVVGPLLGGVAAASLGYRWVFLVSMILIVLNIIYLLYYCRRHAIRLGKIPSRRE